MTDEEKLKYYREGYEAWNVFVSFGDEVKNPYKIGSWEHIEWKRGYNTNKNTIREAEDYFASDYM